MPGLQTKTLLFATFFCTGISACYASDQSNPQAAVAPCLAATTPIASVQGDGRISPLLGRQVAVQGIVTLLQNGHGLYIEEPGSDQDPGTSNAIFVQTTDWPDSVGQGSLISILGSVSEIDNGRHSLTALTDLTLLTQCSDGQPLPVTNVTLPLDEDGREALEGMRIHIDGALTVTDVYRFNQGNFTLAANGFQYTPTELMPPGPEAARQSGQNREHSLPVMLPKDLQLDGVLAAGNSIRAATGVLAHDRRGLRLALQAFSASSSSGFDLPHAAQAGSLRVVGMNLYNYFNGDGRGSGFPAPRGAETVEEFHQQRERIAAAIRVLKPQILGVMELENDGFGPHSAAVDFIQLANEANGLNPGAGWQVVHPDNANTGTQKIRVALFYRGDTVAAAGPAQTLTGPEFRRSRQPIAQVFQQRSDGRKILVVVNHLKSKGSCPDSGENANQGDGQGCWNPARTAAAVKMTAWVKALAVKAGTDNILILGDMNAYRREDPVNVIRNAGFDELMDDAAGRVYSFIYFGQAGTLDYAFVSAALQPKVRQAFIWNVNAALPPNMELPQPWLRFSDHDPVVVDIRLHQATTSD